MERKTHAQPPENEVPKKVEPAKTVAGGAGAILSTLKQTGEELGLPRAVHLLSKMNQKDGFDCPGCAWPDPDEVSWAEFCENGAKAVAEEATTKRLRGDFFSQWSVEKLSQQTDHWLGKQGRLSEPMWLAPGESHYTAVSWNDALNRIAEKLNSLENPNEAAFYTSGRTSNEAAFLYQLMVRAYGTNNLPDCSNMCHESSGVGLGEVIGVGKGTVTLHDLHAADCLIIIGQNPGTNHPRMLSALETAAKNGAKIIAINPLKEAGLIRFKHPQHPTALLGSGTALASHYLQVRINGDVALLKGFMKHILESDLKDCIQQDFISTYTVGFEEFRKDLLATPWESIIEESGISKESIMEISEIIARSERLICCWAMGLTQHKNAVGNIQELVNLLLLGGHFGREGAGACPVRGHSNVQGDRTMGIWEKPSEGFLQALEREFSFCAPRAHGLDTVHSIRAMQEGKLKAFFAMGGNFLSATPDTEETADALRKLDLTVQISTKLNRSHLITGKEAFILPCLGRTEIDMQAGGAQMVTMENSMGIVHPSKGSLIPASRSLRSEVAIVCQLAARLLRIASIPWKAFNEDYDSIRDAIERVIPGFEDYNQRVRKPGGFYLPNPVRDSLIFPTSDGKAHFTVHDIPRSSLAENEFTLMTIRSHDQYNTTIYGLDDRYRGIQGGRRVVFIHPDDLSQLGFEDGETVDIESDYGGKRRIARNFQLVRYDLPRRSLATYFPEANVLIPLESMADKSHTPTSKSITVTLSRAVS